MSTCIAIEIFLFSCDHPDIVYEGGGQDWTCYMTLPITKNYCQELINTTIRTLVENEV